MNKVLLKDVEKAEDTSFWSCLGDVRQEDPNSRIIGGKKDYKARGLSF